MKSVYLGLLLVALVMLMPMASAQSSTMSVHAKASQSSFTTSTNPAIVGTVMDASKNRLSDVTISIVSSKGVKTAKTDHNGSFLVKLDKIYEIGIHKVTITASKQGFTSVSSSVNIDINNPVQILEPIQQIPTAIGDGITNNPVSKFILEQTEIMKNQAEQFSKSTNEEFINTQRMLAKQSLEKDLGRFASENLAYQPQNAFASFVKGVDESVQGIFWAQFDFTQQLTNQGKAAKEQVLKNGGTSYEATQAFQRKAISHREQIIAVNNQANIQFGNATESVQNQFDVKGKSLDRLYSNTME
ncbi:hypothetical protein C6988_03410 [Nitrosopumilus sp. b1]|uniref:carboxypeptidase-like regulatory domain-containing protein n=1 Tax=Nitrosopumilus sp. b1 TaxID=2109907 RepID=UPI0015F724AA|nr:carboxypeptidase-like regulatory domain-containing protein [Nitrosopumilus sp. b1]KAF6243494.1 hypothetical protein C6988_03410 [Nitrosopumilus sp. b1]